MLLSLFVWFLESQQHVFNTCNLRTKASINHSLYLYLTLSTGPAVLCDGVYQWRGPHVPHSACGQV